MTANIWHSPAHYSSSCVVCLLTSNWL